MAPQTTLPPGFSIRELTKAVITQEELSEIFRVCLIALNDDPLYRHGLGTESLDDLTNWCTEMLGPRWAAADMTTWVIVEDATGKIVAWSALQFPWKDRPLDEQEKAMATSHDMPPLLSGMNSEGMVEFFASLNCTLAYDYDPEKDYHRKGTMVLPGFQKKGFGTFLTRNCNAVSDKTGDRTWAPARPTSKKMFENEGYKLLGSYDSHLERWGADLSWTNTYILVRDPSSS